MVSMILDPTGDTVTMKLTAFLGDKFGLYRAVCTNSGARYIPSEKVNRIPLSGIPDLVSGLSGVGIPFSLDPKIADLLKREAEKMGNLLEEGKDRVAKAKERLAPLGLKPFRYQETGIEWLAPRANALLLDDMGLGKTVQALLALPENAPVVIVTPVCVRENWRNEIKRWRPDFNVYAIKSAKLFVWPKPGEIALVSYSSLPGEDLPPPELRTYLIADEVHFAKNPKAARSKKLSALISSVSAHEGRCWGLTGTPLLNRPTECWNLLKLFGLAESAFGSWMSFVRLFGGHKTAYGYQWDVQKTQDTDDGIALALRKVALRRLKRDVLPDLPAKRRSFRTVGDLGQAGSEASKLLETLKDLGVDIDDADFLSKSVSVAFEQISRVRRLLAVAKIPAMLELVESYEESEEPVIVFSCHRDPILELGKREGWAIILGDTSPEDRQRIVDDFQNGKLRGVAGSVKAMGVGLTLTRASNMIFVDQDWTPANNSQAEDRICRIGQKANSILITTLVADHALDNRVAELIEKKLTYIDALNASAVQEDHISESPAQALANVAKVAVEAIDKFQEESQRLIEQAKKDKEQKTREAIEFVKTRVGASWDGREFKVARDGYFRGPVNAIEEHAIDACLKLSAMDSDRVLERNGMGWNSMDSGFGHSISEAYTANGALSDKQWSIIVKIIQKYKRQIGTPCASK